MPQLYDPHIHLILKGNIVVDPPSQIAEEEAEQVIQRVFNLGLYRIDEMEELLDELKDRLENWVGNHPPHGAGE